jgi:cyclohexanone monooxygenase
MTANTTAMFEQQGTHIAWLISEIGARGAATVEPSRQAQDQWVQIIRKTSITDRNFWRECTLGYYNNEGEEAFRSELGEPYGPGFYAFEQLLQDWRERGDMAGLTLGT